MVRGIAAAARRKRYQERRRARDPMAFMANRRRIAHAQRERMLAFLGGACASCGHGDHRALVVVQPAEPRLRRDQLYTLMLAAPAELRAIATVLCANCRFIARHQG